MADPYTTDQNQCPALLPTRSLVVTHRYTGVLFSLASLLLVGCSSLTAVLIPAATSSLSGSVHVGNQPINRALIEVYAAGVGLGSPSTSLVSRQVLTDINGNFTITGLSSCPTASSQVYIVANGGSAGPSPGSDNPAAALLSALGSCDNLTSSTNVNIDEMTTVASVSALAPYMQSIRSVGASAEGAQMLSDAFTTANELVNATTGLAPGIDVPPGEFVPVQKIHTLADILSTCINSSGGVAGDGTFCGQLFLYAPNADGSYPTNTVAAMLQIAQNPARNVDPIYLLTPTDGAFEPTLSSAPANWSLSMWSSIPAPVPSPTPVPSPAPKPPSPVPSPVPKPSTVSPPAPTFSPAPGTYGDSQIVTLTDAAPNAAIYYTTNGSTPSASSLVYSGAVMLSLSQTLRTVAIVNGISSLLAVGTYNIASVASVTVSVTPSSVSLMLSHNQDFTATVADVSNTAVTWSLNPAVGTISAAGFYTAPALLASAQTIRVTATSIADPTKTASASIALTPPTGTTYYVCNCGSDSNDGTSPGSPWQTIAHVNAHDFKPGDSILFQAGGTWREQLNISWTGSATSPLTFGSYGTGAMPVISGGDIFSAWATESGGLYFTPYTTAPKQVFRNGTRLTQALTEASLTTGQWWLDASDQRLYVFDNPTGQTMEADQRPYAILSACNPNVYATVVGLQLQEAQTDGLYMCGSSLSTLSQIKAINNYNAGVELDGPSPGTSVTKSTAAYNGADGFEFYDAPSILVAYDTAYNNVALPGKLFAAGIKFDPSSGTQNAIVEYSNSYSNGVGETGTTGSGIWADTIGNGWTVRHNIVYSNNERGIDIDATGNALIYGNVSYDNQYAGIMAYADNGASLSGNQIYNNTVWGNGIGIEVQGPSSGSTAGGCENNSVTNNIVESSTSGANLLVQFGCENPGTNGSGNSYTYNSLGTATTNFVQWGAGTTISTYRAWETEPGNCGTTGCSHSMQSDPMLTNPSGGSFILQSGSPAIGAGLQGLDLGAIPYGSQ